MAESLESLQSLQSPQAPQPVLLRSALAVAAALALVGALAARADNLLANAEFDGGLSGWKGDFPEVHFSGADAGFSPDSGSMQIDHPASAGEEAFRGRQCVPVAGGAFYEAAALTALLGPDHPQGRVFLEVEWFDGEACAGEASGSERLAESDERYWFWVLLHGEATAPESARSARVALGIEKLEPGDWTLQSLFDRAFFGPAAESATPEAGPNLIANGGFANDTAGWLHDADVVWSSDDAGGNPASGSLEIRNDEDGPVGDEDAEQCFALGPGTYDFHADFRLIGTTPLGTANVELKLYSAAGCPDPQQVDSRVLAVGTAREAWTPLQAIGVDIPAGVASAKLKLETIKTGAGTLVGRYDRVSFAAQGVPGGVCSPAANVLCLRDNRFQVTADWVTGLGTSGAGVAVPLTSDTGSFWFFDVTNLEMMVKVLDGCPVNGRFWVYAGGLTDVGVTLTVTDSQTGAEAVYQNPLGSPFLTITDVNALDACP